MTSLITRADLFSDAVPCSCGEHVVIRPWSTCMHCRIEAATVAAIVAWLRTGSCDAGRMVDVDKLAHAIECLD